MANNDDYSQSIIDTVGYTQKELEAEKKRVKKNRVKIKSYKKGKKKKGSILGKGRTRTGKSFRPNISTGIKGWIKMATG